MNQRAEYMKHHQLDRTPLRPGLPELPARMRLLPVDPRGYPVPWFVANVNGKWDFRVVREGGRELAHNKKLCWLCGQRLGRYQAFVIGPMCAVNLVTSEPPSHVECATFAVRACPFLILPKSQYKNNDDLAAIGAAPPGMPLDRNPGACILWVTGSYRPFRVPPSWLIRLGPPSVTTWWTNGRLATRAEAWEAIRAGLPNLIVPAVQEGREAVAALDAMYRAALRLLPTGEAVPDLDSGEPPSLLWIAEKALERGEVLAPIQAVGGTPP